MTQLGVMELAKQGDPQAIAALINRSLASKGIQAQAKLEANCLKIFLKATQIPNQKAVVTIIHRGMMILQVKQIERIKIFTYRSDNNYLAWQYEMALAENPQQSSSNPASINRALTVPALTTTNGANQSSDLVQNQNINQNIDTSINTVSDPKSVILVRKLSQIQKNIQEYQDIIVRFMDEQVETVRCLTTLAELIQVISQPSFLFAAVASNPNLRNLLDAIAESSKTDEHGDQVIANLSILQPGQQWQKAKIRLVTKIFLEPFESTENIENTEEKHQGITLDLAEEDLAEEREQPIASIPLDCAETKEQPVGLDRAETMEPPILSIPLHNLETSNPEIAEKITQKQKYSPESDPESSEDLFANLDLESISESASESITAASLFEDFSEVIPPVPQVVYDVVESSENSDLFAGFNAIDRNLTDSYAEISNINEDFSSVSLIDDITKPENKADSDLFANFSPDDQLSDADSVIPSFLTLEEFAVNM